MRLPLCLEYTILRQNYVHTNSIPEKEYQECQNKAKAVVQAIQQAQEGFE